MPAWSPEIANDLLRFASLKNRKLDQRQIQHLIYIAHGWFLATRGEPLTSDRPVFGEFGPEYVLLTKAFAACGVDVIEHCISNRAIYNEASGFNPNSPAMSDLDPIESALLEEVFQAHEGYSSEQLSVLTRGAGTPWQAVVTSTEELGRPIADALIRAQFLELAGESVSTAPSAP